MSTDIAGDVAAPAVLPALDLSKMFQIASFLIKLGHGAGLGLSPAGMAVDAVFAFLQNGGFTGLVKAFQTFHGLKPSGALDADTLAKINANRCAHADVMASTTLCKWPVSKVTWSQKVSLATLPGELLAPIYTRAWAAWADVCGIEPDQVLPGIPANVEAMSGSGKKYSLDGPGGVLAWSQLPCGASAGTRLSQVFDSSEQWDADMFLAVATHEIGHAIGIPHLGAGTLMNPYYTPGITAPTAGDIAEAVKRYGPPKPAAAPAPVPAPAPTPAAPGTTFVVNVPEAGNYLLTLNMVKQT